MPAAIPAMATDPTLGTNVTSTPRRYTCPPRIAD